MVPGFRLNEGGRSAAGVDVITSIGQAMTSMSAIGGLNESTTPD
jgi:hypothetical protein